MPKEITNDIEEMDDISTDEAGGSQGSEQPASAVPSAAKDVSNTVSDDDALSVVRDVVDKRKVDAEASSAVTAETGAPAGGRKPKYVEPDDEGFTDVPFHKHPRFQELMSQRDQFKVDATRYRNVQNYIDQNGLSADEAAEMLLVGGMMKVDPVNAWKRIQPTIQRLLIAAGEVLPDDLKSRVEKGEMSREAALDLSRTRAAVESGRAQASFSEQRQRTQYIQETGKSIQDAAQAWENDRRRRDPNFGAKLTDIRKEIVWLQREEGMPNTPQGVQEQLRRAYETVNKGYRAPGRRPAMTPVNGGQVSGDAQPAPQTTMDIIRTELAKRHAQ